MHLQVVVPAFNETVNIRKFLVSLDATAPDMTEVLIIVDDETDATISAAMEVVTERTRHRVLVNGGVGGPANAIKMGLRVATAPFVVVMMADGSDDPESLASMVDLLQGGADLVCASRYIQGGAQIGGPRVKKWLSRLAGQSFHLITRVGTHDVTNCYKAYRREFIQAVPLKSSAGFELGLETVVRAIQYQARVTEVPTVWRDRSDGESRFRIVRWFPKYLRWYFEGVLWRVVVVGRKVS